MTRFVNRLAGPEVEASDGDRGAVESTLASKMEEIVALRFGRYKARLNSLSSRETSSPLALASSEHIKGPS